LTETLLIRFLLLLAFSKNLSHFLRKSDETVTISDALLHFAKR
jgi:hypothetical protein